MLPVDLGLERMIVDGASEIELEEYARDQQVPSLADDAIDKLLAGAICISDLIEVMKT